MRRARDPDVSTESRPQWPGTGTAKNRCTSRPVLTDQERSSVWGEARTPRNRSRTSLVVPPIRGQSFGVIDVRESTFGHSGPTMSRSMSLTCSCHVGVKHSPPNAGRNKRTSGPRPATTAARRGRAAVTLPGYGADPREVVSSCYATPIGRVVAERASPHTQRSQFRAPAHRSGSRAVVHHTRVAGPTI